MTRANDRAGTQRTNPKRWQEPGDADGPSGPLPAREKPTGPPLARRGASPRDRSVETIRVRELVG